MSALFKIGSTDLTRYITVPSYNVMSKDIYEEYSDGNYKFRRKIIRQRISGTFSMLFSDRDEYLAFLRLVKDNKTSEGAITATVYVDDLLEVKTSTFFIEFEAPNVIPILGTKQVEPMQIQIQEQ